MVVRVRAAWTLVLVYMSIRLSETVSELNDNREIQDNGHRTTLPTFKPLGSPNAVHSAFS